MCDSNQIYVNNAFSNWDLSEDVYMEKPPSFEQEHGLRSSKKSSLAQRAWFSTLSCCHLEMGLIATNLIGH